MQKEGQNSLYRELKGVVPKNILTSKNKAKSWKYGYEPKYDFILISRTGQIGDCIELSGLRLALPPTPKKCLQRHKKPSEQYWERTEIPKSLDKIQSIFQWNEMSSEFKDTWGDYIEEEFERREFGVWFMNNGKPTYI